MLDLTERQTQILKTIIEEYIETASPVASDTLDKKYNLGVSPATIRNEMVKLIEKGFLKQPHSSSGRFPTSMAIKFYINQLMEEDELSVADEVTVRERIWNYRNKQEFLFYEVAKVLAEKSCALSIVTIGKNQLYHSGYANILDDPEFFDIDVAKTVFSIIEDSNSLEKIFSLGTEKPVINVLVGQELEKEFLESCGIVFANFQIRETKGIMGVLGSRRLHYSVIIPLVRYLTHLIEEIVSS